MVNSTLFSGLSFCLDGFPVKMKQQLNEEIKKGGGSFAFNVSKKHCIFVVPQGDPCNKFKLEQCEKDCIPVVTDEFITYSVMSGKLYYDAVQANKSYLKQAIAELRLTAAKSQSKETTYANGSTNNHSTQDNTKQYTSSYYANRVTTPANGKPQSTTSRDKAQSTTPLYTNQPVHAPLKIQSTYYPNKQTTTTPNYATTPKNVQPPTQLLISKPQTTPKTQLITAPKPIDYGKVIKSSYFKEAGKFSQKAPKPQTTKPQNGTTKPQNGTTKHKSSYYTTKKPSTTEPEANLLEEIGFGLFDDEEEAPASSSTPGPVAQVKAGQCEEEEEEEADIIFNLFGDIENYTPAPVTRPATATRPAPAKTIERTYYPHFAPTPKEEDEAPDAPVSRKVRANRRDLFLCSVHHVVQYEPTMISDGEVLTSITGMQAYNSYCFEELRVMMSSLQPNNSTCLRVPELAEGSDIWSWGWSKFGQLGRGAGNMRCAFPVHTPFYSDDNEPIERHVSQIACGWAHSICVTENGGVASWGRGKGGRLGHADKLSKRVPTHIDAFTDIKIKYVSCGMTHSAFIAENGYLWTVGSGEHGQLGLGSFGGTIVPRQVTHFSRNPVVFVSCGKHNTAAITLNGHLYTWGSNSNGQLGYETYDKNIATPTEVEYFRDYQVICHVAVGGKHMAAVTQRGYVFTWGANDYCQLGRGGWDSYIPGMRPLDEKAIMVACGESHTVALLLTANRPGQKPDLTSVVTWGRGDLGALGIGESVISSEEPTVLEEFRGKKVIQISCGAHHTAALTARGRLWVWGDNSRDQTYLGGEISFSPILVQSLLRVTQVACGGYHTAVLVSGSKELMLQHAKHGDYNQVAKLLELEPQLVNCVAGKNAYTPLHWACREGHESVVELLIENGADINAVCAENTFTPLHICAYYPSSLRCVRALLAAPNIQLDPVDIVQQTPLHRAVKTKNENVVVALVQAGSDKRAVDAEGNTPLHFAVKAQNYRISRFLVRNAAPITMHDSVGKTPLFYCSANDVTQELRKIAQSHDVFISYAHSDIVFAKKVRMELERNCIKCWMDDQRLEAGSDWRADIGNGILAARLIVFLASPTSIVSDWCLKELKMGEKNGKLIWPVWYQKAEVPRSSAVLFSTPRFIDLSTDELYPTGVASLVRKIKITLDKLDRCENVEKARQRSLLDFAEIATKTFSYLSYLPSDFGLVEKLRYFLGACGIIWVDESTVPLEEEQIVVGDDGESLTVDMNQAFWVDVKKRDEELNGEQFVEVEAEGNDGVKLCSACILVVSKELLDNKDKKIRRQIKFAEQNHKPIVLILKDMSSTFRFAPDDKYFGSLSTAPTFHFNTSDLEYSLREDVLENVKRMVYVIELLYKETMLAEKLKAIEAVKAAQLAEAQRLAEEEAKKKKKFVRV